MSLFIPILIGTARDGRLSKYAAQFVLEEAKKDSRFETELVDVKDVLTHIKTIRPEDMQESPWKKIMERADGLIIVSPEYNHSYPGELKLLLDELYHEYARKPVGICGVSNGILGGARMAQSLRLVMIALEMVPIKNTLYFLNSKTLFDNEGRMIDSSFVNKAKIFFDQIVWYAEALKLAREGTNNHDYFRQS